VAAGGSSRYTDAMSEPSCPGCRQRDEVIASLLRRVEQLEARIAELESRLAANSCNSSVPPSANPPAAPPPVVKKPSGRRRGGQPGHPGHSRVRLPASRVNHTIALIPDRCANCSAALPSRPSPADPEPTWHQVIEIPPGAAVVTEFQGHARLCPCCGELTRHSIPAEIRCVSFGPRLAATLSYLCGCQHVSTRGLEEVIEVLLGVPIAVGTVVALQQQMSQALAEPHEQLGQEVRSAAAKNVDETSWKQNGVKHWLWVAVAATAVYLLVHRHRSAAALKTLLGEGVAGIITSDRWSAYHAVPIDRRQICWAHLKRDFQAMVEAGGKAAKVGEGLLLQTAALFEAWYRVRDGTRTRRWLARRIEEQIRGKVKALLRQGSRCSHAPSAGTCAAILDVEEGLWTFASHEGVEPTNNEAERALRGAVIKRKKSFGSHSACGCVYVARLLSVVQTLRRRGAAVLDYLTQALDAHRHGMPAPPLPAAT
jgi:transposase